MPTVITAERLWDGSRMIDQPLVAIEDGRITSISTRTSSDLPNGAHVLDFPGATLAPAFFDVHIHGAAGHDVMEATPEALEAICDFLASRGTGSFLATTVTAPLDATLRAVEGLAKRIAEPPVARSRPSAGHSSRRAVSVARQARRAARGSSAGAGYRRLRPAV